MKSFKKWLYEKYENPCKKSGESAAIFDTTSANIDTDDDDTQQENNIINILRLGLESFSTTMPSVTIIEDDEVTTTIITTTSVTKTTNDSELNNNNLNINNQVNVNNIIESNEKENVKINDDTIITNTINNSLNYQETNIDYNSIDLNEYDLIGVSADDAFIINEMRLQDLQLKQQQQQKQPKLLQQLTNKTTLIKNLIVKRSVVESKNINDNNSFDSNIISINYYNHDDDIIVKKKENNKKSIKKYFLNIWNYRIVLLSSKKSPTINHRYEQIVIANDKIQQPNKIQPATASALQQSNYNQFYQIQKNCINVPSNNCCTTTKTTTTTTPTTNFSINKQSNILSNDSMEKSSTLINLSSSLSTIETTESTEHKSKNITNLIQSTNQKSSCFFNTKIKFIYETPEEFFYHNPNDEIIRLQQEQKQLLKNDWCIIDYIDYDICKHANFIDDISPHSNHHQHFQDETIRCGNQATTTFNHSEPANNNTVKNIEPNDIDSYVNIKRTPSVISLTSYAENDEHGIFYDPILTFDDDFRKSFEYCGECLVNIKMGIKIDNQNNQNLLKKRRYSNPTSQCEELLDDNLINNPSVENNIIEKFGLNEHGRIIINFDHIIEKKSNCYWLRKSKYKYTNIECGKVINDDLFVKNYDDNYCCYLFRNFFNYFNLLIFDCFDKPADLTLKSRGSPSDLITNYVLLLGTDHTTTFSRNIEKFLKSTKSSLEINPQNVMKSVRQFICGMKTYLLKYGEGDLQIKIFHAQSLSLKMTDEFLDLDDILESVMHKLIVLPLKDHIYNLWVNYFRQKGDLELLIKNINYASVLTPIEMGIRSTVIPPTLESMCYISLLLLKLQQEQLPLIKLKYLLAIVSAIYESTTTDNDHVLSADDLLPLLVYIITKCGFIEAEIEIEFMWSLLQQNQLNGEAGYYLTALASAVHVIKGFIQSNSQMSVSSVKNYDQLCEPSATLLRIRIPNEIDPNQETCTVLLVQPKMNTQEVCKMVAQKVYIDKPNDYGLFKIVNTAETILLDTDYPLEMVQTNTCQCTLVFKRLIKNTINSIEIV